MGGRTISGRIVAINGKQITLDRSAGKVGDTFTANHDGIKIAKIALVKNITITLDKSLDLAISDVWAIISDDLKLMQFKVLAVKQMMTIFLKSMLYSTNRKNIKQ